MTDGQILDWAASVNHAVIIVCKNVRIGPGAAKWAEDCQTLTARAREELIAKINRWHELVELYKPSKGQTDDV